MCTDSLSALQTLDTGPLNNTDPAVSSIWLTLHNLATSGTQVDLQLVPGHAGIAGNEEVDGVAKEGCSTDQLMAPISLEAARRFIARESKNKANTTYADCGDTSATVAWR